MAEERNRIKNESGDAKYFAQVPRIVSIMCDPFELAVWIAVKTIVGEQPGGECWLSTRSLAKLTRMSKSQVDRCRKRLLDMRLLDGEVKYEDGKDNRVWHLTIPDIWAWNIEWATDHPTIKSRIEFIEQMEAAAVYDKEVSLPGTGCPHEGQGVPARDDNDPKRPYQGQGVPTRDGGVPVVLPKNNLLEEPIRTTTKNMGRESVLPLWELAQLRINKNYWLPKSIMENWIEPVVAYGTNDDGALVLVATNYAVKEKLDLHRDQILRALEGLTNGFVVVEGEGI